MVFYVMESTMESTINHSIPSCIPSRAIFSFNETVYIRVMVVPRSIAFCTVLPKSSYSMSKNLPILDQNLTVRRLHGMPSFDFRGSDAHACIRLVCQSCRSSLFCSSFSGMQSVPQNSAYVAASASDSRSSPASPLAAVKLFDTFSRADIWD
jgi:hypothetical protein